MLKILTHETGEYLVKVNKIGNQFFCENLDPSTRKTCRKNFIYNKYPNLKTSALRSNIINKISK